MPTSTELTQLVSGDPNTLFLAIKSFDKLLPEMKSHIFPHAEHHEGDGGAGTVSTYGLHEDRMCSSFSFLRRMLFLILTPDDSFLTVYVLRTPLLWRMMI